MSPSTVQPLRVAYLVSQYPKLSHSFIESEVVALRGLGVEVSTFSINSAEPSDLLTPRARDEAAHTVVLLRRPLLRLLRAVAALVAAAPAALLRALATAVRTGPPDPRARLFQVFYLAEAVILWHVLKRRGLRHVHVHLANNGADVARLAVLLGRLVDGADAGWRWTLSVHGPAEFENQIAVDLAAKVRSASAVACISDFCRSQIMRLLPPARWDELAVVRMAVDTARFSPADGPRRSGGPLRVLTVGRLVPEKGAPLLVEAVAKLAAAGTPVELVVVGAGPLADDLAAAARAHGIADRVEFVGPVGQDALPAHYRDADVFCLPSFAEGLPVVLMEAMAAGLPVVTTAIAGIPELVVDRKTGLLLPPGRADLIAAALTELAADPELARTLGARARAAVAAQHDPADNARLLVQLLAASPR